MCYSQDIALHLIHERTRKKMTELLAGKVAVVTGGTRGIGLAIVKKFLENGCKVVLFGSRQETVDKALSALRAENPAWEVEGRCPNLGDPEQMDAVIRDVAEKYGRLDILVNNAGISQRTKLYDYQPGEFEKIMELNVTAMFHAILPAAKIMKAQGGGVILNTSSMVSISGQSAGVGYPTSKFAVNGLTLSLARELGPDNIRVNAVAPGVTRTDMLASLPEEMVARVSAPIPLRRVGEPEEVANAFLFLASDMASYVTGEVLSVDGAMRT
jgi:3-oxoacyl-[acyl-carrier protein] reductase/7-alpha-hydroxysteroid dehydrogenase